MELLTDHYQENITGTLSCHDRILILGTLPGVCYAEGMTSILFFKGIKVFDYPQYAATLRDKIRDNTEQIAKENKITIQHIRDKNTRKESLVKEIIQKRGDEPGLVCILSAMELCPSYRAKYEKRSGKSFLRGTTSKCIHYYFYYIDEILGLIFIRVPTWCPFSLQIYLNGHNWLASKLNEEGISFRLIDNAFVEISDFERAQELADTLSIDDLHKRIDALSKEVCPIHDEFKQEYHWSIKQCEYATDIIFKGDTLQQLYPEMTKKAIHTVKLEDICSFLGKKLHGNFKGDVEKKYQIRIMGTKIKHRMGKNNIKIYDKFGFVLRIETTSNDISTFKCFRTVAHRDRDDTKEWAPMRRYIYSLHAFGKIAKASNRRYLQFISTIEDDTVGRKRLNKVTQSKRVNNRNYRGINPMDKEDALILNTITRGEYLIYGFQNKDIRNHITNKNSGQVSRILKRMKELNIIKKTRNSYKYYATNLGQHTTVAFQKMKEAIIIPELNYRTDK